MFSFSHSASVSRAGLAAAVAASWLASAAVAGPLPLVFSSSPANDLYRVMSARGATYPRYDSAVAAIEEAPRGGAVLILADGYPANTTTITPALLERASKKKLRLYIEYPSGLPGLAAGVPRDTRHERAVVASGAFGPELKRMRILAIHGCRFIPMPPANAAIVLARVAGFDRADYGLPAQDVHPVLFEHNGVLVAATKLSHFVTGRYMPADAWASVWKYILEWLCPGGGAPGLKWSLTVRPAYRRDEPLPPDAERQAFRRGIAAYHKARLLVHPAWKAVFERAVAANDGVGTRPGADWPEGDGTAGVLEGFASRINYDGSQPVNWTVRNDCVGETSFSLALAGKLEGVSRDLLIASNLNDYIYTHSILAKGPRSDPKSPSFGLIGWHTTPKYFGDFDGFSVYYGDDNARSLLGTLGTAAVLKSDRWDEGVLRCLLANLRTTGRLGFRGDRLDERPLQKNGWRHYWTGERINYAPHYEAYLWAAYLWAYDRTRYQPFLDRAESAIRMTVAAYPHNWRWTNGIQQERARMLLPLAWLVRVQDTPEHREWLRKTARDMLALQDSSGALQEELGILAKGRYRPPVSNEEYGEKEASLISRNGDPVADMLYTSAFAFLGLHEAAAATGEPLYADSAGKLAGFLVRIQTRSEAHPELDGWWYRAFEFRRWEYWASNADLGWGPWCTETGWSQSWITAVLGMRQMRTSLWQLSAASGMGKHLDHLLPVMIPAEP